MACGDFFSIFSSETILDLVDCIKEILVAK